MTKKSEKDWRDLEGEVRRLASVIWNAAAEPEEVAGVRCDCVLKPEDDRWILIEVSRSDTLSKLRIDVAKFVAVRNALWQKEISAKCYFLCDAEPHPSLRQTGKENKVRVLSLRELRQLYYDYSTYRTARLMRPFGSAVNPISGEQDMINYVPVRYENARTGQELDLQDLAKSVQTGNKIVLLGEYGTGKSRCISELFALLSSKSQASGQYTFAVDLRDNWGIRRCQELLRRHAEDLGLTEHADRLVKIYAERNMIFLLDGFDEIASQSWTDDQAKLRQIRRQSLEGVRDLLQRIQGGALIAGREHYFNSDLEMFESLGLDPNTTQVVRCKDQFTYGEMQLFLDNSQIHVVLPEWLPRRPLICQTIAHLESDDLERMFDDDGGDVEFWHKMIDVLCARESRIHPVLHAATIKEVLRRVARITRFKPQDVGPISFSELNKAFESVVGIPPVDESAAMLQRLPGLGRIKAESPERQFIDTYILDGLRAVDVVHCVKNSAEACEKEKWINPLASLGQRIAADLIEKERASKKKMDADPFLPYAQTCAAAANRILAGDILGSLLRTQTARGLNLRNMHLDDGHIRYLDLATVQPRNLAVHATIIDELLLPTSSVENVAIEDCVIRLCRGVSSERGLPSWMKRNDIESFESVNTTSAIRRASLTTRQAILVGVLKKCFFQKGSGRKEAALQRGFGDTFHAGEFKKVINFLVRKGIITRFKGDEGWVYTPSRSHGARVRTIMDELTVSNDELWRELESL